MPDRPAGVDHKFGGEAVAPSDPSLAGRAASEASALLDKAGAGRPMDGAVDAPAAEEGGACGVDDGVDRKLRDVAEGDLDPIVHLQPLIYIRTGYLISRF
jgi:hypothetical protein